MQILKYAGKIVSHAIILTIALIGFIFLSTFLWVLFDQAFLDGKVSPRESANAGFMVWIFMLSLLLALYGKVPNSKLKLFLIYSAPATTAYYIFLIYDALYLHGPITSYWFDWLLCIGCFILPSLTYVILKKRVGK